MKIQSVLKLVHLPAIHANGIVDFQSEHCNGCGYCIAGCPLIFRASTKRTTAFINVRSASIASAWAVKPACVKTCPTGAIHRAPKRDAELRATREKLKARGFEHAGISTTRRASAVRTSWQAQLRQSAGVVPRLAERSSQIDTLNHPGKGALLAAAGFIATFAGLILPLHRAGPE